MRYVDYMIVGAVNENEVIAEVKGLLAKGWVLVGGLSTVQPRNGSVCMGQALALPEKEVES